MSNESFFASNGRLKQKENPYVKHLSINEALAAGAEFDMYLLEGLDHDEPELILWCEREELFHFPSIWVCDSYVEHSDSDKKYFAGISGDPLMDLPGMISYIQEHMSENPDVTELELWDVWLGDDEREQVEKTCNLKDLTVDVLAAFFDENRIGDCKLNIVR